MAQGREGETFRPRSRPVTALVLSGGGARGAAHVGVLAELENMRIPVDLVVGTSMGSIVGGLYASGYSPDDLEKRFLEINWIDLFDDRPARKNIPFRRKQDDGDPFFDFEMGLRNGLQFQTALIMGQKFGFELQSMTLHTAGLDNFDDLRIPYRAVATDLRTGEPVVLDRGSLGTAMRASMAVPSVFAPVEIDGRFLVDGGIVRNLPIDVARELGAERIIAVDISSRVEDLSRLSMFSVAQQSLSIYGEGNVNEQRALLGERDVLLVPQLDGITSSSFDSGKLRRAIDDGAEAARGAVARLSAFAVSEAEYAVFLQRQRNDVERLARQPTISGIAVEGNSRVASRQVLSRIKSRTGDPLDLETLQDDLSRIYEIGEFQHAAFRLDPVPDGSSVLVIELEEKPWGPNYVRFGLALKSNVEGRGEFTALAQLTRTQINARGGEWKSRISVGSEDRLFTEFYQPLDFQGFLFVASSFLYFESEADALSTVGELERIRLDFASVAVDAGIQFRNVGELRFGVVRGTGTADFLTQSELDNVDVDIGGLQSNLVIDRLDNANFPRAGMILQSNLLLSRESLGAEQDYEQLDLFAAGARSRGKNTILAWVDGATNLGSDIPFYERVELGGFLNVSGLDPGAATGNLGGVATALYYRQVARMSPALGKGFYVGGSIETGGAWESSSHVTTSDLIWGGSLFVGADTKFGPLYLAYGRAESGEDAFYFFLGQLFSDR